MIYLCHNFLNQECFFFSLFTCSFFYPPGPGPPFTGGCLHVNMPLVSVMILPMLPCVRLRWVRHDPPRRSHKGRAVRQLYPTEDRWKNLVSHKFQALVHFPERKNDITFGNHHVPFPDNAVTFNDQVSKHARKHKSFLEKALRKIGDGIRILTCVVIIPVLSQ